MLANTRLGARGLSVYPRYSYRSGGGQDLPTLLYRFFAVLLVLAAYPISGLSLPFWERRADSNRLMGILQPEGNPPLWLVPVYPFNRLSPPFVSISALFTSQLVQSLYLPGESNPLAKRIIYHMKPHDIGTVPVGRPVRITARFLLPKMADLSHRPPCRRRQG